MRPEDALLHRRCVRPLPAIVTTVALALLASGCTELKRAAIRATATGAASTT